MTKEFENALNEYGAAMEEKIAASKAEDKARVRSQKAYHRLVMAKQELRAAELEAQEPIYVS